VTLRLYSILISILLIPSWLFGATLIVDNTLGASITNGTYSISGRSGGGSDGNAYKTLQEVIWGTDGTNGAASVGDTIYLRGGTYSEDWSSATSSGAAMQIPTRLNGTAWTAGNYTTISSYPGEWAVINGDNVTGNYFLFGYGDASQSIDVGGYSYWKIERLEITGGMSSGLAIKYGPVWVRYCYIHTNGRGGGDSNRSGIHMRNGMGNIIEYNLLHDNGNGTTSGNSYQIENYGDYLSEINPSANYNWTHCNRDNIVRYNYFTGTYGMAWRDKAAQWLGDHDSDTVNTPNGFFSDMTHQDAGNEIHHNIIAGTFSYGVAGSQDFEQIHHNIVDGGHIAGYAGGGEQTYFKQCIYNNTVLGGYIAMSSGYDLLHTGLDASWYCVNNIVQGWGMSSGGYNPSIGIVTTWGARAAATTCMQYTYTWTDTTVNRNFIYEPTDAHHFGLPNTYAPWASPNACAESNWVSQSTFDTARSTTNYTNSTAGLFAADGYTASGSFVIGSTTIAEGGIGGAHPYLSGVTIPSYVGAVNPSDSDWVAGVLALDASYFTSATNGSDPSWIEGSGSTPTIRNGSIVNGGVRP